MAGIQAHHADGNLPKAVDDLLLGQVWIIDSCR
jgi:hypothetical protein